ncbi:MAG TPA: hypothetical protein P5161_06590, partial [Eubacteriales bacterium]|nr:hypothetical protein [Eubacteriales bacterium]
HAAERSDAAGVEEASRGLEAAVRKCAKDIRDKYINPPRTTDWAVLFVPKVALAFSVISLAGFYVLALLCFSIIILWAPNMLHTGYSTGRALSEAVQIIRGNNFKIASALGLASLLPLFFMVIFSVFELKIMGLSLLRVVDSFCYLFLVIYYIILMYTAFFDLTGTDRADFGRKFKWS